jgi:SAM-dependent methyltransferase
MNGAARGDGIGPEPLASFFYTPVLFAAASGDNLKGVLGMTQMTSTLDRVQTDEAKAAAFGERLIGMLNDAATMLMTSLGHRTGLFDTMASLPASTVAEIADQARLSERYVREWLGEMTTAGFVDHDPDTGTYFFPQEHAAWLTRSAPVNIAAATQFFAVLGGAEDAVAEAFRHGKGVPYSAYHRFHEVMAEESAQTVVSGLDDHILPLAPDIVARLAAGIDVLDIGCGAGRALQHLASRFPRSRFVGYDLADEAIAMARRESQHLPNLRFEVRDLATLEEREAFDLITAFDVIHDQAKPDRVLSNVRQAMRKGRLFLMQDISCAGHHHRDREHVLGPFLYTISCMHCMSVSLANGGPGLGATWGKAKALEMLDSAGFDDVTVETLPHDAMNFWFLARV